MGRGLLVRVFGLIAVAQILAAPGLCEAPTTFSQPDLSQLGGFDTDDGLSHNTVYAILQDRHGFLWLGTEEGLNRYDGYEFKVYRHDPLDPASLSHNDTPFLLEDRQGQLWIATWGGGLNRFEPQSGTFVHYRHNAARYDALPDDQVTSLLEDDRGMIWVATYEGGLSWLDPTTGLFTRLRGRPAWSRALPEGRVWAMKRGPDGQIWLASESGLVSYKPATSRLTAYRHEPGDATSLSNDVVRAIHVTGDGIVWAGTARGLNRLDPGSGAIERFYADPADPDGLSDDRIYSLHEDSGGRLWIGTGTGGLNVYDPQTGTFDRPPGTEARPNPFATSDVRWIFEDRSKILWIGTRGNGLGKLDLKPPKFGLLPGSELVDPRVRAIAEDQDGRLWIGTQSGIERFDRHAPAAPRRFQHRSGDPSSLPGDEINALLVDRRGRLWVSVWRHGLSRFISDEAGFTQDLPGAALSTELLNELHEGRGGEIWIGSAEGLLRLDPDSGEVETFRHDRGDPHSLSHDTVSALLEDRDGRLWVGTRRGGLNWLEPESGRFERFRHDPQDPTTLSAQRVYCLYQHPDGRLWVGTARGLDEVLPDGQIRRHSADGKLPSTRYFGILGDESGQLWLSTSQGLWSYAPDRNTVRQFTVDDGLQGEEFRPGAYERAADGTLFFGGQNGFNFFRPEDVIDNRHKPRIALTGLTGFDGEDLLGPVEPFAVEALELPPETSIFTFHFAALELTHPQDNRYLYRLEPYDYDWLDGSERTARYHQIPPGRYTFRVRAANGDGVWADDELALPVRLLPPIWQTWWWRLGSVSLLLFGLAGLYRIRTRQLRNREEELSRRIAEGLEDLRQSEQRYRTLFERNLAGVLRAEISGKLLDCNQAFASMLGYATPEECKAQRLNEGNEASFTSLVDRLQEGEVVGHEQVLRDRDGDEVHLLWNAHLVEQTGHSMPVLEATVIDVSERRRIEDGLRHGQKLESLGVLAGGIAHDFNNILMGILGHTEIAKRQLPPSSPAWKSILGIEKAADRAAGLANQMLAYSGKGRFQRERIDLSQVVKAVAHLLRPSTLGKVRLRYELDDDLPAVEGDPVQLDQVVLNLITNAIEAVAEQDDAEVVVSTSHGFFDKEAATNPLGEALEAGNYVALEVRDNGCGMSPEVQQKIFDPFFSTKFTGRGLGLAAVLGIVRGHHGALRLDSEPERGTRFRILLPAAARGESRHQPQEESPELVLSTTGGKALIIDDEEAVRAVTSTMVKAFGYQPLTAEDGRRGVALFTRYAEEIEFVLLDLTMPEMDGEEVLMEIRKIDGETPVILMSGYDEQLRERPIDHLASSGFIKKPFRLQTLRETIRQLRVVV